MRMLHTAAGCLLTVSAAASSRAAETAQATAAPPPPATRPATDPASAADAVAAVTREYDQKMQEFSEAYRNVKTDEERQKLFAAQYPQASRYSTRLLQIAKDHPKAPAALAALTWIVQHDNGSYPSATDPALDLLARDFAADPDVRKVVTALIWAPRPQAEGLLRAVLEKNADRSAKGTATFALACWMETACAWAREMKAEPGRTALYEQYFGKGALATLAGQDPGVLGQQAESLFEKAANEYGDVEGGSNGTLGQSAKAELFELRNLGIGQKAPEIAGEDVGGKPLKLSDFAGKVVVLDFFGDW